MTQFLNLTWKDVVGFARLRSDLDLVREADRLEAELGEDAVDCIRRQLLSASRASRRKLYRLHDELARRRRDRDFDLGLGAAA